MGDPKQIQISAAIILVIALTGCAQGNCRSQSGKVRATANTSGDKQASSAKIKVFKYDGSLQCGEAGPVALKQMQADLKNIKIYSSENKADGLMHISQCGTPTGRANVYEISADDLEKAKQLGFKEWLWE